MTEVYTTLSKAFQFDILSGQRAKAKVGLAHTRRRFISIVDAIVKLNKSEADIFEVCGLNQNLKLTKRLKKSGDEEVLIEYFENNSIYGTLINRNSRITIISPHSNDGFNLGHYSYCLAEDLNANYVSVEKYGIYSFPRVFIYLPEVLKMKLGFVQQERVQILNLLKKYTPTWTKKVKKTV